MQTLSEEQKNTNILSNESPNQLFGKSDELPRNANEEIDAKFMEERSPTCRKLSKKGHKRVNRVRVNTQNILPVSSHDFTNNLAKNNLDFGRFMSYILYSVFHISPHYHCALLILGPSIIRYRAQMLSAQFVFKLGDTSKATQSLLSLGEACTEFFPQIIDMMTIMQCYVLVLWLVCPLPPVLQIFIVLMLIAAPCYYIPGLMGMASGVGVNCGSFKVPLIWFTVWGALALSLIFAFLALLVIFVIQRYIHPEKPRLKEVNLSLDALSEILNPTDGLTALSC